MKHLKENDLNGIMLLVKATELVTTPSIGESFHAAGQDDVSISPSTITVDDDNISCSSQAITMSHLISVELSTSPRPTYMIGQPSLTIEARAGVVLLLMKLHCTHQFVPEMLSLAVNILDRILTKKSVTERDLKLFGVMSLIIASKLLDTYQELKLEQLLEYLSSMSYTKNELIHTEQEILERLNYRVSVPTAYTFLYVCMEITGRIVKNKDITKDASFILDSTLPRYHLLEYMPSEIAFGSIFIARILNGANPWSEALATSTMLSEEDIVPIARSILSTITQVKCMSEFRWMKDKYDKLNDEVYYQTLRDLHLCV